jgi:quercetin dioxygenase-like cupin family protein
MRGSIMQRVAADKNQTGIGFKTLLSNDGWSLEAPGLELKILNEEEPGVFSYLIRLAAGFKMEGHDHPVDEECLMLEGDLTLGSITLNAGDYHFAPKGMPHGAVSSKNGCMAFLRGAIPAVPQSLAQS